MAKFGESTARPLPQEDQSGVRKINAPADEGYEEAELIEEEDAKKRGRKSPPPSRAKALRRQKQIAETPFTPDKEVHDAFPKAKKRKFYTPKGTEMAKSTPETRARFEEERAEEREEMKRFMEKKEQERQEVLKRLEELEHRILETGDAADKIKAERERIEAESREEQEAVKREAMERVEASAAAREIMNEPMEGVARQMGREQAGAALAKELEGFESQLRMDEKGHVSGMKNVPYLNAHAVLLALPAMWKEHDFKRALLTRNKPPGWKRRMKSLDIDAERLTQMREKADELIDAGHRDARVRNFFYRHEGQPSVEGADQTELETLLISPEKALDDRERLLQEEEQAVERAIEEVEDLSKRIDDLVEKKQEEIDYATELVEIDEALIESARLQFQELNTRRDINQEMLRPERLDVYGNRLQLAYDLAKEMIETRKKELATFKGGEGRAEVLKQIGEEELKASEAREKLTEWKEDPVRARAMGYRLESLQDEAAELSGQIRHTEQMLRAAGEHKAKYEGKAEKIIRRVDELPELVDFVDEKMQYLLQEKTRIVQDLADVRRARVMQEAPPQGEEIDVEFPEDEEELDIDIDTSDFDEQPERKKAA